jgi:GAF domain-containing protein
VVSAPDSLFADLLASLAATSRALAHAFDPRRFLDDLSARLQPLIPHDRLVVDHLAEDGVTFTVFAERVVRGPVLHADHYTSAFDPEARYVVADWAIRRVFAGDPMRVDDFLADPRFSAMNPFEARIQEGGLRSGVMVPLPGADRIIGAMVATSFTPGLYTEEHVAAAGRVAALLGPFVENVVLRQREQRRRRRLRALEGLAPALGGRLDVGDIFGRLADVVRPVLDFDVMGVGLISVSGRDVERLAEVDNDPRAACRGRPSRSSTSRSPTR